MAENPIDNMLDKTMQRMREMVDVNTIVGEPLELAGGTIVVPISKVSYGFAIGGSEYAPKAEEKTNLFGGGSGAGVTMAPVAFLTIVDSKVQLLRVEPANTSIDRVIDMVPGVVDKISDVVKKRKKDKEDLLKQDEMDF